MKIAEVSERYGLSSDTLRYYERIGLLPTVTRTESGIRAYSELDIRRQAVDNGKDGFLRKQESAVAGEKVPEHVLLGGAAVAASTGWGR